jgi:hypothetical protein
MIDKIMADQEETEAARNHAKGIMKVGQRKARGK